MPLTNDHCSDSVPILWPLGQTLSLSGDYLATLFPVACRRLSGDTISILPFSSWSFRCTTPLSADCPMVSCLLCSQVQYHCASFQWPYTLQPASHFFGKPTCEFPVTITSPAWFLWSRISSKIPMIRTSLSKIWKDFPATATTSAAIYISLFETKKTQAAFSTSNFWRFIGTLSVSVRLLLEYWNSYVLRFCIMSHV